MPTLMRWRDVSWWNSSFFEGKSIQAEGPHGILKAGGPWG